MMLARRVAGELQVRGTYAGFHDPTIPHAEANQLVEEDSK
jgi:hypothetical protein